MEFILLISWLIYWNSSFVYYDWLRAERSVKNLQESLNCWYTIKQKPTLKKFLASKSVELPNSSIKKLNILFYVQNFFYIGNLNLLFFSEIIDFRIVEYVFCHSMAGLHLKCYEIRPIFRFETYRSNLIARKVSPKRQRGLLPMTFLLMYTRKKTARISKTMLACPGPNAKKVSM